MVSQGAVDTFLQDLRDKRDQAQNTFGTDDAEVHVHPNGRVVISLQGHPQSNSVADINRKEQEAHPVAAELRQKGARVTVNSENSGWRVTAIFEENPEGQSQ